MRRVDVLEQRSRVVGRQGLGSQFAHPEVREQPGHPQLAALDARTGGLGAPPAVQRTERLESAARSRHDRINPRIQLLRSIAFSYETLQQGRRDERQIAREDQHPIVPGVEQGGIQPAERARAGYRIRDDGDLQPGVARPIVGDDPDIVSHRRERRELAVDDARAPHDQRGLVGAAEAPCKAPRENGRRHTMFHALRYHADTYE